jgi:hypothetical protein
VGRGDYRRALCGAAGYIYCRATWWQILAHTRFDRHLADAEYLPVGPEVDIALNSLGRMSGIS